MTNDNQLYHIANHWELEKKTLKTVKKTSKAQTLRHFTMQRTN